MRTGLFTKNGAKAQLIDNMPVRVLLVDDNIIYLRTVSALLSNKPEVEVVGCAVSGEEALELMDVVQPDLILLDLKMPGMDGLEVTRRIRADSSATRIAIVTASCDGEHRAAAEEAGADDFICKDRLTSELRRLVNELQSK